MRRCLHLAGWGAAVALLLAACGSGGSGTGAGAPTPTPAAALLLAPAQVPGYTRTPVDTVSADQLASEAGDPSAADRITGQGLLQGARATYQPQPGATDAFEQVTSEALLFRDATGAAGFFADEVQRRTRSPEGGGTVTSIPGLPATGVDQVAGLDLRAAPQEAGGAPLQALLFVIRRGAAVAELLGSGPSTTATLAAITPLLNLQEAALAAA